MTLREAPQPRPARTRGGDQLLAALAFAVTTATIGGFVAWLAWQIHTIAGWLG